MNARMMGSNRGTSACSRRFLTGLASGLAGLFMTCPLAARTTINSGQDYLDECAAAGVPTPPPWNYEEAWHGSPNSQWVRVPGVLTFTLAGTPGTTTEVFYYSSTNPPGVCAALPRSNFPPGQTPEQGPPTSIGLLGIICQGVNAVEDGTAKACFWDNSNVSPFTTLLFGDGPPATHFIGGAELALRADVCSDCHRGENVFIIHPEYPVGVETPLFSIPNRAPSTWHEPIVPATWPENPGPTSLFDVNRRDSCLACHHQNAPISILGGRFPEVSNETSSYCGILRATFGTTMPYGNPGSPESAEPVFTELDMACDAAPGSQNNPSQKAMSFDGSPPSQFWTVELGTLTQVTDNKTEGTGSVAVNAGNYVRLDSIPFATWQLPAIGTELDLDVYVAPGQPNPYWLGAVQLFVTIPSAQMFNNYIGQVELTPGGTGWRTAVYQLPSQVRAALLTQRADVRWGVAVNRPGNAPPILLDNMRFNGTLSLPPAPPSATPVQYDFERGGDWEGREGIVTGVTRSLDQRFTGFKSLQVNISGSSDGRVWTAPAASPPAGATVRYRVFIPSGAPVSAVQPYVMDHNWVWSDSWNPNLPRGGWVTLSVNVPQTASLPLNEIGVKLYLSAPYDGPVYLDSIQW